MGSDDRTTARVAAARPKGRVSGVYPLAQILRAAERVATALEAVLGPADAHRMGAAIAEAASMDRDTVLDIARGALAAHRVEGSLRRANGDELGQEDVLVLACRAVEAWRDAA